jgi:hypothetical protein
VSKDPGIQQEPSCKGQVTQATLNLIMFYHNHRRYKSGKRQGKAPIELLTGKPLDAPWWELLRRQLTMQPGLAAPQTGPARTRLHLVSDSHEGIDQQTLAADQTRLDFSSTVAEHEHQDKHAQAASSFSLGCNAAFVRVLLEKVACADIEPYQSSTQANC